MDCLSCKYIEYRHNVKTQAIQNKFYQILLDFEQFGTGFFGSQGEH